MFKKTERNDTRTGTLACVCSQRCLLPLSWPCLCVCKWYCIHLWQVFWPARSAQKFTLILAQIHGAGFHSQTPQHSLTTPGWQAPQYSPFISEIPPNRLLFFTTVQLQKASSMGKRCGLILFWRAGRPNNKDVPSVRRAPSPQPAKQDGQKHPNSHYREGMKGMAQLQKSKHLKGCTDECCPREDWEWKPGHFFVLMALWAV